MPRRKRSYVPKQKGCHECSKRRINCDRTEPACRKCVDKGISCSGLGIRYRFVDETTSEHDPVQDTDEEAQASSTFNTDSSAEDAQNVWAADPGDIEAYTDDTRSNIANEHIPCCPDDSVEAIPSFSPTVHNVLHPPMSSSAYNIAAKYIEDLPGGQLGVLSLSKERTLDYFSERIAGEMVVIDDDHNGWRSLVLPVAHLDELVMDAVLSASAFHYRLNVGNTFHEPSLHYMRAIKKLQQRQDLATCSIEDAQKVLLAILVLLVTVMINGSPDFPMIFKLLQLALDAIGRKEALFEAELGGFLEWQIKKLCVHAAPFLSRTEGIESVSLAAADWIECFRYYSVLHPEYTSLFSVFTDLELLGQNIYVKRVTAGPNATISPGLVEEFKECLSSLPADSPGKPALVWATFMAASECSTAEDRRYFHQLLLDHYQRSGFLNIHKAIEHLQQTWSLGTEEDWTALLPEPRVFIV